MNYKINNTMKFSFLILFSALTLSTLAGEPELKKIAVEEEPEPPAAVKTFHTTRIINGHAVDMLRKRELDFRILHRFGDMATSGAGKTLFGIDNAADIRISLEYGISNKLNVGLGRSKGAGPQTQLFDGFVKYNILQQMDDNSVPLSLTLLGTTSFTSMDASTDSTSPVSFHEGEWTQRLSYSSQLMISRKFSEAFSLQISPTYVHRNYVAYEDKNGIFAIGAGIRVKVAKKMHLLAEYYYLFPSNRVVNGTKYYNPVGIGVEIVTFGHVFHITLTNSAGLGETQFIPHTYSDLTKGQFRLGFTISRIFNL